MILKRKVDLDCPSALNSEWIPNAITVEFLIESANMGTGHAHACPHTHSLNTHSFSAVPGLWRSSQSNPYEHWWHVYLMYSSCNKFRPGDKVLKYSLTYKQISQVHQGIVQLLWVSEYYLTHRD